MTRSFHSQQGSAATSYIWLVLSAVVGSGLFLLLLCASGGTLPKAVPYAFGTWLVAPVAGCTVLLSKLFDLKEQSGLNRDEQRRLKNILDVKIGRVITAIILMTVSGITLISSFYFLSEHPVWFRRVLIATGALAGLSVYALVWSFLVTNEITSFRANLKTREETKKKQRAALKHLKKKNP